MGKMCEKKKINLGKFSSNLCQGLYMVTFPFLAVSFLKLYLLEKRQQGKER